ncbi:MAG: MFS transporter [Geodermatophilaceae bacterium]|nr:MFS transporter [Geodermatophilaceae bacterium]
MMGIGTVLLISQSTGRYALAGAVSGVLAITGAVAGPVLGRLVDRFGQARVLLPFLLFYAVGVIALVVAVRTGGPVWTWFVAAVAAGVLPQFGSLVRARWAGQLPPGQRRQTAFAFESVVDEVVFVTGPPLVTFLAIGVDPAAGLVAALVFAVAGGLALASRRDTEPPPTPSHHTRIRRGEVLRPGLIVAVATMFGTGAVFGSVEVIVVAYAEEEGHPGWAGAILALWAFGSLVAGVVYGSIHWRRDAGVRFLFAATAFGLAATLLLSVRSLPMLAVIMLLSGVSISPVLIGSTALVDAVVPPAALTEGLGWITTGLITGITFGAVLSGPLIDGFSAQTAFALPAVAGLVSAAAALAGSHWLRPPARRVSEPVTTV